MVSCSGDSPSVMRVQRVFVWPVSEDLEQLRRFAEQVMPAFRD